MKKWIFVLALTALIPMVNAQQPEVEPPQMPSNNEAPAKMKREKIKNERKSPDEQNMRQQRNRNGQMERMRGEPPESFMRDQKKIDALVKDAKAGSDSARVELTKLIAENYDRNIANAEKRIADNKAMIERQEKMLEKRKADREQSVEQIVKRLIKNPKPDALNKPKKAKRPPLPNEQNDFVPPPPPECEDNCVPPPPPEDCEE